MHELIPINSGIDLRQQIVHVCSDTGDKHADDVPWLDIASWVNAGRDVSQELHDHSQSQRSGSPLQFTEVIANLLRKL